MKEQWKDVVGYEGRYKVSNLGKVKSINYRNTKKEKVLSMQLNNSGYYQVQIGNTKKTVHRLVAEAFLGKAICGYVVNHIDENKLNNNVLNLEWVTQSQNVIYSLEKHPKRNLRISKDRRTNITKKIQQISNGTVIREWENSREIFKTTGMSDWSISECCRGKRKKAYGFSWQYAN